MDSNSPRPETHNNYPLNSKIMLAAIIVLFSVVLLILAIHLYVRYFIYRRTNSRRRRNLLFSSSSSAAPPRSLDPSIISSLPVLIFDADVSSESECSVCLCEFAEGEKVRVLPRCEHCFHVGCIDMWFGFHGSCPLCRTAVSDVVTGKEAIDHLCAEGEGGSSMSDVDAVDGDDQVSIEIEDGESAEINTNLGGNNSSSWFDLIKRLFSRNRRLTGSGDEAAVDVV